MSMSKLLGVFPDGTGRRLAPLKTEDMYSAKQRRKEGRQKNTLRGLLLEAHRAEYLERAREFSHKNLMNGGRVAVSRAFGQMLKEYRRKVGYSQEELADIAEIDRTYPSLLERGKRVPTLSVQIALACALKITPIELYCSFLDRLRENTKRRAKPERAPA